MSNPILQHTYPLLGRNGKFLEKRIPPTPLSYGLLYNWYVISDGRNISPIGWHIPTLGEWNSLISYLGGTLVAGGKLKEIGTVHWSSPNTVSTDEVNFSAVGGGFRYYSGIFIQYKKYGYIWSTYSDGTNGDAFYTSNTNTELNEIPTGKGNGISIRYIKDDSTFVPIVTGNDGKVYSTIQIGSQIWTIKNSAETKYRNGDVLTNVTDDTTWSNLFSDHSILMTDTITGSFVSNNGSVITLCQGFTLSSTQTITKITLLQTYKLGSPDFNIRVSLYTTTSGLPNTKICDSINVVTSSLITYTAIPVFYFNQTLSPGVYCWVTSYEDVVLNDTSNRIAVSYITGGYGGGSMGFRVGSGSWIPQSGSNIVNEILFAGAEAYCYYNNDSSNM